MPTPLPSFTLEEARSAIEACLAANAGADVDRVGRASLDALDAPLRSYLGIASMQQTPDWYFSQNWRGPSLADVIHSCAQHREMGRGDKMRKAAA
jgi:hypothetical protein